jgi:hypothetical protein
MALTILDGSTFCICDELGDVQAGVCGLYAHDTRFLSALTLTINGAPPLLLSSGRVEYFSAAFYSRNPLAGGLDQDVLVDRAPPLRRRRAAGPRRDPQRDRRPDRVHGRARLRSGLRGTSSASSSTTSPSGILSTRPSCRPPAEAHYDERAGRVVLEEGDGRSGRTQVVLSRTGTGRAGVVRFPVTLAGHQAWDLRVDVAVSLDGEVEHPEHVERRFGTERARVREAFEAWSVRTAASQDDLRRAPPFVRPVRRRPRRPPPAGRRGAGPAARRGDARGS